MDKNTEKTLVIYTGGTIGMEKNAGVYHPASGFGEKIKKIIEPSLAKKTDLLELSDPFDSSNLNLNHWSEIAKLIINNYGKYTSFVIAHGTDTMAYTASALSFMLMGVNKSVILTGSQIPLSQERSDGIQNLNGAILLAAANKVKEVGLFFNNKLLRGNRSSKINSESLNAFASPNFPALAKGKINFKYKEYLLLPPSNKQDFQTPSFEAEAVAIIYVHPEISANNIANLLNNSKIKALIIMSFGVGGIPNTNCKIINVLNTASKKGIIIVSISQCFAGGVHPSTYATSNMMQKVGIISGKDMTLEATFTKLHFLLSMNYPTNKIKDLITQPLCGEVS